MRNTKALLKLELARLKRLKAESREIDRADRLEAKRPKITVKQLRAERGRHAAAMLWRAIVGKALTRP